MEQNALNVVPPAFAAYYTMENKMQNPEDIMFSHSKLYFQKPCESWE